MEHLHILVQTNGISFWLVRLSLKELYNLQELDLVRVEKQQALSTVRAELADESSLRRAQQRLAQVDAHHTNRSALRRDAQLIVEQLEARAESVQERLYSGAVTNPRELEAFQEEQAKLGRQISEAEDVLLERMVETEELEEELAAARSAFQALEEQRRERVPQLRIQEQTLVAELDALELRRAEMLPLFPPQMLSTYETLLASRGGQAVSKVELARGREICGICRVALPTSDSQRLRGGDPLVQCNNCRRILYVE